MSSDNPVWKRLFDLRASIDKMIVDGTRDPVKVAEALQAIVNENQYLCYLRRLYGAKTIVVGATDGTETFASSGLFTGGVYGLALPACVKPIPATNAAVYEMTADGTYAELFESLGTRCRWTESQVCAFVRAHKSKLRTDGYGTFFEMEGGFVAVVRQGGLGQLRVSVHPFRDDCVWYARDMHRLVSPQ